MLRRIVAGFVILSALAFTQLTPKTSAGEWLGYGYVGPVAYTVGSPYGYYYYAGYNPYQVVSYPYGVYGYYFPYRYHYAAYPYGYYGNYVTYPITWPASYVPTYPVVGAPAAAVVPGTNYAAPAGYKLVPADANCTPGVDLKPADRAADTSDVRTPRSANADEALPPAPASEETN